MTKPPVEVMTPEAAPDIARKISDEGTTRLTGIGLLGAGLYIMRPDKPDQILAEKKKALAGASLYAAGAYLALSDNAVKLMQRLLGRDK